jgi:hypothetical protein
MRKVLLASLFVLVAALLLSPGAKAEPITITLEGCTSCQGSSFTLSVTPTGAPNQYTVTLTIDSSGFSGLASATQITSVEFKLAGSGATTAILTDAPGGAGNWTTIGGPLSNGGCMGSNDTFVCSNTTVLGSAPLGGILTWTWTVTLPAGATIGEIHIGAKYNNSTGTLKGNIVSESVVIPEPGTLALFGLGLAGIGGVIRRRQRKAKA